MDQALLLTARDCFVGCVEIGHQDALEVLQHGQKKVALSSLPIDVSHFFHVCKHPHKSVIASNADLCFVGVEQTTAAQPCKQCFVGIMVHLRCPFFDVVGRVTNRKSEAKQFV